MLNNFTIILLIHGPNTEYGFYCTFIKLIIINLYAKKNNRN